MDGEFQLDDFHTIVENPDVKVLAPNLTGFFSALFHSGRPVTQLSFALNYAIGRLDPWTYHAVNLAIHLAAVVLVFIFGRAVARLAGAARPGATALVVAGLFALHPLQTQAVSYVVQRSEALASALYLAVLLLLLESEGRGLTARGAIAWCAGVVAFVLGLGAKVIVVTLPVTYLLLTWMVPDTEGRKKLASWPRRLAMLVPWIALDGWFAWSTMRSLEDADSAGFELIGLPVSTYFVTQWKVIVTYLRLLVWPAGQNVDWAYPPATLGEPGVLASGLLLVGIVVAAGVLFLRSRSREDADGAAGRLAAFGILWFFVLLSTTSSIVPLADPLVEHRVYLASWGMFTAVVVLAERTTARMNAPRRRQLAAATAAVVWCALALATHGRNAAWESRLALWTDSVSKSPLNGRAHLILGAVYHELQQYDLSIREHVAALDLGGRSRPVLEADIQRKLGAVLIDAGRHDHAMAPLLRALELSQENPDILFNLATLSVIRRDRAAAESFASRAIAKEPNHGPSLSVLGRLLADRGDAERALPLLVRAAETIDPDDPVPHINLIFAYAKLDRVADTCAQSRRAQQLALTPDQRKLVEQIVALAQCR